ncbi:hypothetical protein DIPPA_34137 [Diplonema papillatum]|nr:hypothetical protein DIPPA_34137 [Diplonema papillatum]
MDTTAVPHRVVSLAELQVARKARGKQVDNEPFEERDSVTTTLSVPRRDEDFETMRNYDPRNGGEHYRTFAWHMSVVLVLLGFITTGVAGVTVYWRRDGCLLYKLLFLEGTTEACCGSRYLIPRFASFFGGRKTFYPGTPEPADASQQCTNVWDWEAGDAQTAHFFAIFFVFLSLSCRSGAIVAYLTGHQRRKNVYPWLTLACGLCGLLCLVGYSFAWSGRHLSAGPALWFVGLQMVVDFVAYCSTMSSTRLDQAGKRRAKIDVVMSAWHEMPRRVKFVFAFFLLGWLAIAGVIATPWIVSSRLCEDPAEAKAQGKCCKDYYVLFVRDSCGPAMSSFKLENVTWMAAHVMATILIAISVVFRALATYYGWRNPTLFPRRAIIAAWLMVLAVTVYGGLTTTTPERFTKVYVATVCYEAINLILLHLLYIKYHTQLWSPNFAERRRNPGWKDPLDNERPILVTKQRTRRIGFLGREFYRKDINSNGATGAPTVKEGSRATSPYRTSDVKRQTVGAPSPTYRHPTQNASNAVGQWQAGQQKYVLGEPIRFEHRWGSDRLNAPVRRMSGPMETLAALLGNDSEAGRLWAAHIGGDAFCSTAAVVAKVFDVDLSVVRATLCCYVTYRKRDKDAKNNPSVDAAVCQEWVSLVDVSALELSGKGGLKQTLEEASQYLDDLTKPGVSVVVPKALQEAFIAHVRVARDVVRLSQARKTAEKKARKAKLSLPSHSPQLSPAAHVSSSIWNDPSEKDTLLGGKRKGSLKQSGAAKSRPLEFQHADARRDSRSSSYSSIVSSLGTRRRKEAGDKTPLSINTQLANQSSEQYKSVLSSRRKPLQDTHDNTHDTSLPHAYTSAVSSIHRYASDASFRSVPSPSRGPISPILERRYASVCCPSEQRSCFFFCISTCFVENA